MANYKATEYIHTQNRIRAPIHAEMIGLKGQSVGGTVIQTAVPVRPA